jgi:hypothetical protein
MKNVLHFQIDTVDLQRQGIKLDDVARFLKVVQNQVKDDYYVIASPTIPSAMILEDEKMVLYNFEMKEINLDQLKNIIKGE